MELVSRGVQDALQANAMHPHPPLPGTQAIQEPMDNASSDSSTPSFPELASANNAVSSIT